MGLRHIFTRLVPLGILAGFSVTCETGTSCVRADELRPRVDTGDDVAQQPVIPVEGRLFNFGRFIPRLGGDSQQQPSQPRSSAPSRAYDSNGSLQPAPDGRYPTGGRFEPQPSPERSRVLPRTTVPQAAPPSVRSRSTAVPSQQFQDRRDAANFEPRRIIRETPAISPPPAPVDDEGELTPVPRRGSNPTPASRPMPTIEPAPRESSAIEPPVLQAPLAGPSLVGPSVPPPADVIVEQDPAPQAPGLTGPTLSVPTDLSTGEPVPLEPIPRRTDRVASNPADAPARIVETPTPDLQPVPRRVKENFQPALEPVPRRRAVELPYERSTRVVPPPAPDVVEERPSQRISIAPVPEEPEESGLRPEPNYENRQPRAQQSNRHRGNRNPEAESPPPANPFSRFGVNQIGENMRRMMLFRRQ